MALVLSKQDILRKPPLGTQINSGHPLAKGLVGCWLMNEGGGNKIYDLSINNALGTLQNSPPWVAGTAFDNYELSFTSTSSQYVSINKLLQLADFTVSLWLTATDFASSYVVLSYSANGQSFIGTLTSNTVISYRNESTVLRSFTVPALTAKKLYHLVLTRTGSTNRCYINTVESSTGVITDSGTFNLDSIGYTFTPSLSWNGHVNNVLIYNRGLSPSEIRQLYAQPFAFMRQPRIILPDTPPLVNTGTRFWFGITF